MGVLLGLLLLHPAPGAAAQLQASRTHGERDGDTAARILETKHGRIVWDQ